MAEVQLVPRRRVLSGLLVAALLTAAVHSPGFASPPEPGPAISTSQAGLTPASETGDLPTARHVAAQAAASIPVLPRACLASISKVAACLGSAAYAACAVTFSKFLACTQKVYSTYNTTKKIQEFRASSACPTTLSDVLVDYLCTSRAPQAPRTVVAVVDNGGHPLEAFTGPSRFYPYVFSYFSGARVSVVCVASVGQTIYFDGGWSPYWSRLSNGLFLPWIALDSTSSETVPWC